MAENQKDYYATHSKALDFFIGVGIYLGFIIIFVGIQYLSFLIIMNVPSALGVFYSIGMGFLSIGAILAPVLSFVTYKKKFSGRKCVKYGMVTMLIIELIPIVLFLLLLGFCIVNSPTW